MEVPLHEASKEHPLSTIIRQVTVNRRLASLRQQRIQCPMYLILSNLEDRTILKGYLILTSTSFFQNNRLYSRPTVQDLKRRGSGSSIATIETIDSQSADVARSRNTSNDRFSTPTRQLSKSSLDGIDVSEIPTRRYASPQTKNSLSKTAFEHNRQIVSGRSSTPVRATWKY